MLYESVFRALAKHDVKYVVVGGVAVTLHGIIRATMDLDIIADLTRDNLEKLVAAMNEIHYVPRLPVRAEDLFSPEKRKEWVDERNLVAFTFWNGKTIFDNVDVLLSFPVEFSDLFKRGRRFHVEDLLITVASIEDLLAMKRNTGRSKDIQDIAMLDRLREIQNEEEA